MIEKKKEENRMGNGISGRGHPSCNLQCTLNGGIGLLAVNSGSFFIYLFCFRHGYCNSVAFKMGVSMHARWSKPSQPIYKHELELVRWLKTHLLGPSFIHYFTWIYLHLYGWKNKNKNSWVLIHQSLFTLISHNFYFIFS